MRTSEGRTPAGQGRVEAIPAGSSPARPVWRPEHVDAAWLTEVLRGAGVVGEERVVDLRAEPVGTGQMADSVRLRLTYDAAGPGAAGPGAAGPGAAGPGAVGPRAPGTVIGKFTPADETSRATALALRTSEVEVRFYQEVADTVGVRTPHCYFADVDPTTAEFCLVLEDMAPACQGDQMAGCTVDEAALALAELARLHAPRWGDPALERLSWLERRDSDGDVGGELLPILFEGFVERYGGELDDGVIDVGRHLFPRIGAYLQPRPGPRTVQHADYRLDNLLFGGDQGAPPVTVVDWQTVTLGPGPADVSYFLGAGLVPEQRRAHEHELVRSYHEHLLSGGVTGYSWDDCMTEYRRHAYAGYVMAVGASMLVERTDRGDEMFLTMARRHAAQVEDLDAAALLDAD